MYPPPFAYHRAHSLEEASQMLADLGEGARILAGGQSLIPLMKLRFAQPAALVDVNFIPGLGGIQSRNGSIHIGALARHAEIEASPELARVPVVHDCAAGIADVQVRNRGTIGGSVAEADPSGDWAPVLLVLGAEVRCTGPAGERAVKISHFITDAYSTMLAPAELVREIIVKLPAKSSGGAYLAFKRSAPVYASASAAVQLTLEEEHCRDARIALGCVGLTPIRPAEAEAALNGRRITAAVLNAAAQAAMAAAEPQSDMRGTAEYKRVLVGALLKRAIGIAVRRARGERVEAHHEYVAV